MGPGHGGRFVRIPSREVTGNLVHHPRFKSRNRAAGGGSGSIALRCTTRSAAGPSVGERELSLRRMGGKAATQPFPGPVALRCRAAFLRDFHLPIVAGLKGGKGAKEGSTASQSLWLSSNPSKRWGEAFFLLYTPFWLTLNIGIVVPYKLYERFTEMEYLLIGLVSAVPAFLIPIFVVGEVHIFLLTL